MQEDVKQPKEDLKTKMSHLKEHVGDYVNTYVQIAKAKAVKSGSTATAAIVIGITAFFFAFFFLFFVGFLLIFVLCRFFIACKIFSFIFLVVENSICMRFWLFLHLQYFTLLIC